MKLYRFEKEDGAGPFFDINGNSRGTSTDFKETNYFWAFTNLKDLKEYFKGRRELIEKCKLMVYTVPPDQVIFETQTKVSFPREFKINGIELTEKLWED